MKVFTFRLQSCNENSNPIPYPCSEGRDQETKNMETKMKLSNKLSSGITLILGLLLLSPKTSNAAPPSGMSFLKYAVGAKANALGGAYLASANDASAISWNPAALASIDRKSV